MVDIGLELDSVLCPICQWGLEDILHLFFQCEIAQHVWRRVDLWLELKLPSFLAPLDMVNWIDIRPTA